MNKKRPVNLDLTTMSFPPMAIASILHRISGIVLFLLMPVMLYWLHESLASSDGFQYVSRQMSTIYGWLILMAFIAAMIYHILAGLRHLIMDLGFGEQLASGRRSAIVVIVLAVVLTIITGIYTW